MTGLEIHFYSSDMHARRWNNRETETNETETNETETRETADETACDPVVHGKERAPSVLMQTFFPHRLNHELEPPRDATGSSGYVSQGTHPEVARLSILGAIMMTLLTGIRILNIF